MAGKNNELMNRAVMVVYITIKPMIQKEENSEISYI